MEMQNTGKLEHLKVEDIGTEPFLFRKRNEQEMTDYDEDLRQGPIAKNPTETRVSHGSGDGLRRRNRTGLTTWNNRNK
jgi:hypothetical protein